MTSGHKTRTPITAILVALAAGLLIAASGARARPEPVARIASNAPQYTGLQLPSPFTPGVQTRTELNLARASGANTVRVDIGWSSLFTDGPRRVSRWAQRRLDRFMGAAARRGLKVLAIAESTPCWASSAPAAVKQRCQGDWWNRDVVRYPPKHVSAYAGFVRWLTHRYGNYLAAVEVWNEPDQDAHAYWMGPHAVQRYAAMLKAAYPAAKRGNPNVPVLAGAMAGSDIPFLRQLYRLGIRGYYDGLSVHPYCEPNAPNARVWPHEGIKWSFDQGLAAVHRAQVAAHDSTPIWITEFGWATGNGWAEVSPATQAAYTTQALRIAARMPYVQSAIIYALRDAGSDPSSWMDNLGLVTRSGHRKPAYFALEQAQR